MGEQKKKKNAQLLPQLRILESGFDSHWASVAHLCGHRADEPPASHLPPLQQK